MAQKLVVLRLIEERKEIITGKFSQWIIADMMEQAWIEIVKECRSKYGFGSLPASKKDDKGGWKHLRDVSWYG